MYYRYTTPLCAYLFYLNGLRLTRLLYDNCCVSYYFTLVEPKYYQSICEFRYDFLSSKSEFDGCGNLEEYEDIEKWDLNNKLFEHEDTVPPGYPISYEYLFVDNDEVVGMINFRLCIENYIYFKEYGGHIGYSVKPSKRNKGIGTIMLRDFLPICKEYGLDKIMISCIESNIVSRKIIINNGGVFETKVYYPPKHEMLERYWIKL